MDLNFEKEFEMLKDKLQGNVDNVEKYEFNLEEAEELYQKAMTNYLNNIKREV